MKELVLTLLIIILGILTFNVVKAAEIDPQIKNPQPGLIIDREDGSKQKIILTCKGIDQVERQARIIAEFHSNMLENCGAPSADGRCVAEHIFSQISKQAYLEMYTWLMLNQCHSEA